LAVVAELKAGISKAHNNFKLRKAKQPQVDTSHSKPPTSQAVLAA
jgi:hypothetical protein